MHGITDGDVAGRPPFPGIAPRLATFLDGCDLAGFGIARFDLPLLEAEFARAEIGFSIADRRVVDALSIFHDRERRDLSAAVEFYTGRPIEDAHSALSPTPRAHSTCSAGSSSATLTSPRSSTSSTASRARDAATRRGSIRRDAWCGAHGEILIRFGRYNGRTLAEVAGEDPGYLEWILGQDFSDQVKEAIAGALAGPPGGGPPRSAES